MQFLIRMGIPEMEDLWTRLQSEYRSGAISKKDTSLYKKWGKALKLLSDNPRHPGLRTHDTEELTERYGERVWQSYLENKTSGAMRMYWVYGPDQQSITIIDLEPHPEDKKNGAYNWRSDANSYGELIWNIGSVLETGKKQAVSAVNQAMVRTY